MRIPTTDIPSIIGNDLNIARKQVNATIKLLDDGATIPFIARYRKESTGDLTETDIRNISQHLAELREYLKRREFVVEQLRKADVLTPELADRIEHTLDPIVLEDIYLPYKSKRQTRAEMARQHGAEPLAKLLMAQQTPSPAKAAAKFLSSEMPTVEEALKYAADIIAEWMSENEKARSLVRSRYQRSATFSSTKNPKVEDPNEQYANYYDYTQPLRMVQSHRYLAVRRGEEEGILKVKIAIDDVEMTERLGRFFVKTDTPEECAAFIRECVADSYKRLIKPSIESEIAQMAKERADMAAISQFAENLEQRLMSPPMFGRRIMGIDPGFRTGCKIACLDTQGNVLTHDVINPHTTGGDPHGSAYKVTTLVDKYKIDVIAVGSGTAGRETERFLRQLRFPHPVQIISVSEDGASVYSASEIAIKEFPELDVTIRGAISIARRVLDPLSELVKIEPKSIGVGQYQHDVDQAKLQQSLDQTVESCVNNVGVNVNTASEPLLSYVSGIGPSLARYIVEYREENGPFKARSELMNVNRMGEKAFQQCAGFLRIPNAENPLDNTAIHPERYSLVEQMAGDLRSTTKALVQNPKLIEKIEIANYLQKDTGESTLRMITEELAKPGRDPRGEVEVVEFAQGISSIGDIRPGMELTGKINNITAFGAFVDLGIKENGLLHVSQMSDHYINNPLEVVHIDQTLKVKVMDVDYERGRIALTLKS